MNENDRNVCMFGQSSLQQFHGLEFFSSKESVHTYVAWKQASGSKVKRMHVGMYVHFVVMKWDSKRWVWFEFSGVTNLQVLSGNLGFRVGLFQVSPCFSGTLILH